MLAGTAALSACLGLLLGCCLRAADAGGKGTACLLYTSEPLPAYLGAGAAAVSVRAAADPLFPAYMHERYAFPADIFALLLFLCYKKYFWVVLSTQLLTLLAYQPFLLQNVTVERSHVAIAYLAFLGVLARVIYKRIQASPPAVSYTHLSGGVGGGVAGDLPDRGVSVPRQLRSP